MELGDVPGWLSLALAAGALWISYLWGRRSAQAAERAVAEARRSSDAAERSATAAEEALALQREEAEERRRAAQPAVHLHIDRTPNNALFLRNAGDARAVDVRLLPPGPEPLRCDFPNGVTLEPGEQRKFTLLGSLQRPAPDTLRFTWEGQEDPVPLSVPPRRG